MQFIHYHRFYFYYGQVIREEKNKFFLESPWRNSDHGPIGNKAAGLRKPYYHKR